MSIDLANANATFVGDKIVSLISERSRVSFFIVALHIRSDSVRLCSASALMFCCEWLHILCASAFPDFFLQDVKNFVWKLVNVPACSVASHGK